jgi:carbon-monoxide dehydrogenase medium subunit
MEICDYTYHRPKSLAAACELGRTFGSEGRYLAGGTELIVDLKNKRDRADHVISLQDVTELKEIFQAGDVLHIGALATLSEVAEATAVRAAFPVLREAVLSMGGVQIRNQGTIGGNFCRAVPCADTPPICIAAGARLKVIGAESERTIPAEDFFLGPRQTVLQPDEILVEIQIPAQPQTSGASYQRFSLRRGLALAVASVAAVVVLEDKKIRAARVVLGSVAPLPLLVGECSQFLVGQVPTDDLFRRTSACAAAAAQPITDLRGSEAYRRELVEVLTLRALTKAATRARGEHS